MTDPHTARAELGSQVMQAIAGGTLDQSVLPLDVRRAVTAVRDADSLSYPPYCGATRVTGERWWTCALPPGHEGNHEARHIDRGVLHSWPQAEQVAS